MSTNTQPASERTCGNCACMARMLPDGRIVDDGRSGHPVCRRSTPGARYVPVQRAVIVNDQPQLDARGRPRMESVQELQIGYPPVTESATCWDGWRPLHVPPGERYSDGI